MPSSKHPSDPDHFPFEYTAGVTIPAWQGLNLQGSSAFPSEHELRTGQNIRPSGDGYTERGGQAKFITVAVGSIEGMHEATDVGAPRDTNFFDSGVGYGFAQGGYQGHSSPTYPSKVILDNIDAHAFRTYNLDPNSDDHYWFTRVNPSTFGSRIYVDCSDPVEEPFIATYKGTTQEVESVITPEADEASVYGSCVDSVGVFHFLALTDAGTTRVYTWDGVTKTLAATLTDAAVRSLYTVGTELYAYGTAVIHRRSAGGVWSTIAMPANVAFYSIPTLFSTKVWFGGENTATTPAIGKLYSWNGAALVLERTMPDINELIGGDGSCVYSLAHFDSKLYYGWGSESAGLGTDTADGGSADQRNCVLGKYDGAAWTDVQYEFTGSENYGPILVLFTDAIDLYAVVTGFHEDSDSAFHDLYHSDTTTTTTFNTFNHHDEPLDMDHATAGLFKNQVPVVLLTGATV